MTLDEYLAKKERECQYAIVINNNGSDDMHEAIIKLTSEQMSDMRRMWTNRYFEMQDKRAEESREKKYAAARTTGRNKKKAAW